MMECPRCGFVQPEDQFCANCGLDVEHFQPAPTPIHKKLVKNPSFHLGLILVVVALIFFYIRQEQSRQTHTLNNHFTEAHQDPQVSSPPTTTTDTVPTTTSPQQPPTPPSRPRTPTESPQATQEQMPQQEPTPPPPTEPSPSAKPQDEPAEPQVPINSNETEATAETMETARGALTTASSVPNRLNIDFVELPVEILNLIFAESQVLSESPQVRSVAFPDKERLQRILSRARRLPGQQNTNLRANASINIDFTDKESEFDETQGLNLQIVPTRIDSQSLEFELSGFLRLESEDEPETQLNLTGNYTIPHAAALLIAGIVPHRSLPIEIEGLFRQTPLSIMDSPDFIDNLSEFVIVVRTEEQP